MSESPGPDELVICRNPRCSKSRQTSALPKALGILQRQARVRRG